AALVVIALCAGALLSAGAGVFEMEFPLVQRWLMPFKTQPTFASGFLRASGTFQYAHTAAMYLEACLPLLLRLAAGSLVRPRRGTSWLVIGAVAIVSAALVASASRAGLTGAAITLALLAWIGARKLRSIRSLALISLALLLAVFVAHGLRTGLL